MRLKNISLLPLLICLLSFLPMRAQKTVYYVTADGLPLAATEGIQKEWTERVYTLAKALELAKAGDEVWILGYEIGRTGQNVYPVPEGGFKVKSGVQVFGGFSGRETLTTDRPTDGELYRMHYRTVLTADTGNPFDANDPKADKVNTQNYIFPTNSNDNRRADNQTHVIDVDMDPKSGGNINRTPTILNGLVIARGHAKNEGEVGGGVYIHGSNQGGGVFRIERCFFIDNYGTMGGGVYVAAEVKNVNNGANLIDRCAFFNNAAGERAVSANRGGAVCIMGEGYVFNSTIYNNENGGVLATRNGSAIVNCTITRNTGAGVDGAAGSGGTADGQLSVDNSVVWGNAMLTTSTADMKNYPLFKYSAFPEALGIEASRQNIALSEKNNDPGDAQSQSPKGPSFTLPSVRIGYDVEFDITQEAYPKWNWEPLEETSLVDKGSNALYDKVQFSSIPHLDLNGHPRKLGSSIDIGAYEFQPLADGRRRYVKAGAHGDGTSWDNASGDLQKMIDALAADVEKQGPGEVWVAGGTYTPSSKLMGENASYSVAFRMRDGVSVYGGFLGGESRKDDRPAMDFPWESSNKSSIVYLKGHNYDPEKESSKLENNRWNVNSESRHVVWFAPATYSDPQAKPFKYPTILDRVCVRGGKAAGDVAAAAFEADKGGGVYMNDANAYMRNCVVKESEALREGGGVYLKNGRIIGSLVYNCNAGIGTETGRGGGVFVDETGMVLRSMVTNNTADLGAGVYLDNSDNQLPHFLVLSTSVVSNNTARVNGAVYCHQGGVLTQNTITNNYCPTATDNASKDASQTGGVYINAYGTVINSIIWNNKINLTGQGSAQATDIPVYALNPSSQTVKFFENAISGTNNAVWNNTLQTGTLLLGDRNATAGEVMGPDFDNHLVAGPDQPEGTVPEGALESNVGAIADITWIRYYWRPAQGSNLWAAGMPIGQYPDYVLITPELDITGTDLYDQKPSIGAFQVKATPVRPQREGKDLVFYVDGQNTDIHADGSSWDKAFRALSEAVSYFARLTADEARDTEKFVVRVKGQELWPRFTFANEDPKTATLRIPVTKSGKPITIEGSWHVEGGKAERNPLQFRTILNSNHAGRSVSEGNYHGVNVDAGAKVELDGFHIINAFASKHSTAAIQSGAGVLAKAGSSVVLRNCILENNTARTAAAVDARDAASLTMINCVVNNNTNDNDGDCVIGVPSNGQYQFAHLTVVNNIGATPLRLKESNSFAAGNSHANTYTFATTGKEGAANFTNPTNKPGASLGFNTYLGGYSEFRPLTSSVAAGEIINKGTASSQSARDITMVRDRDLGGRPDLGAYEAELPAKGRVYYVRTSQNGGNDEHNDGLSWETAFASVRKAVEMADKGLVVNGSKPQVWVAAGTYLQNPQQGSVNCFEILDGVNVLGAFPRTGTPGLSDRHPFISDEIHYDKNRFPDVSKYETILKPADNSSGKCRVLGQADKYNPNSNKNPTTTYINVGAGNGNYEYAHEAIYGPKAGGSYYHKADNAEEYVPATNQYADCVYKKRDEYYKVSKGAEYRYADTHDKVYAEGTWPNRKYIYFLEVGQGHGDYTLSFGLFGNITGYHKDPNGPYIIYEQPGFYPSSVKAEFKKAAEDRYYSTNAPDYALKAICDHRQLTKAGVYPVGQGKGNYDLIAAAGTYYETGEGKGSYRKVTSGDFIYPTVWDGFTLRDGRLNSYGLSNLGSNGQRNGGAGAAIFKNVTLKNCIVTGCINSSSDTRQELRGGGVYCDEGTLVNCYVQNNTLGQRDQYTAYGGGVYLYKGTMYNCVVYANQGIGENTDGAGLFIEFGKFFNNTVVNNHSSGTVRGNGGICIYNSGGGGKLTIYNCISLDNTTKAFGGLLGSTDIAVSNSGVIQCYNSISSSKENKGSGNRAIYYDFSEVDEGTNVFKDKDNKDFRLGDKSKALNMGNDEPVVDGETIHLVDYTDMDFTDRIKDCRVDAGAYESENKDNIQFEQEPVLDDNGNTVALAYTFYVSQNGQGNRSGAGPQNAACAMKLQQVLDKAGEVLKSKIDSPSRFPIKAIVKVAGYPDKSFVYHANTLSDPNDPQSYTFTVPYGVTLMGGFCEGLEIDGTMYQNTWKENHRNAARFMTVLSAVKKGTASQDVNGYHALTFREKPHDWPQGKETETLVDGVFLEDGDATSLVPLGDHRTRGGGAIVPAWAHLRNCVVRNNRAHQGGGLYVLPGGLVTGCGIMQNEATYEGGGIYADNGEGTVNETNRGHLISNTIVENKAQTGGGIYLEDGGALTVNSAIWGNSAGSDKNVSGVVSMTFPDKFFSVIQEVTEKAWYPFNNCFIEQAEYPSNFGGNNPMTGEKRRYFAEYFTLKPYSALINKGMIEDAQAQLAEKHGLSTHDMQGIPRLFNPKGAPSKVKKIDVGAYAYQGGQIAPNHLVKRLFVSLANNLEVKPDKEDQYMGRSFFTSFSALDDAFDYIRAVRDDSSPVKEEARQTTFEILMAAGTYKPTRMRANPGMKDVYDQRHNSFTIPYNVEIYGSFIGNERYSSDGLQQIELQDGTTLELKPSEGDIPALCKARPKTDHNGNKLLEPWELANQTILSGDLSLTEYRNAFHVVYSEKEAIAPADLRQRVLLDGLTIMKGMTHNSLQMNSELGLVENEVGRGGGIFSKGVEYALANCRVLENKAVRGGGIFVWDANLYLFNNLVAGNHTYHGVENGSTAFGGGVFVAATKHVVPSNQSPGNGMTYRVRAINNLFANNSSDDYGGAIAAGNGQNSSVLFGISSMNNTFVRNKADHAPIIYGSYGDASLVNTLLWGNEGNAEGEVGVQARVRNSASDVDYHLKFGTQGNPENRNLLIGKDNYGLDGPRFNRPTPVAGAEGYDSKSLWNPVAISPITDNGYGEMVWNETQKKYDEPLPEDLSPTRTPNYRSFWEDHVKEYLRYKDEYEADNYKRYSGPIEPGMTFAQRKPIDIGCYEYQYYTHFSTMPQIFVAEKSSGNGSGSDWDNATDDLRGAVIGASHPTQNDGVRTIYVKSGRYASMRVDDAHTAFPVHTGNEQVNSPALIIKGSCKGSGGTDPTQDFSKPSYLEPHPQATKQTHQLIDVVISKAKEVTLEGFCFTNPPAGGATAPEGGTGVEVTSVSDGARLVLRQSSFRANRQGVKMADGALNRSGRFLAVNTLFADNATGLANPSTDRVTLVNTTFANNHGADMQLSVPTVYNSVSWNNGVNRMAETQGNHNKVFTFTGEPSAHNADVLNGPNFRDPLHANLMLRDYRIRPSRHLLDQGSNQLYLNHAMEPAGGTASTVIPDTERDLYGTVRQVGERVDLGAYEYEALLQPIIYVRSNLATGSADGSSWENATGDLQGAVDLAGIYANSHQGRKAYVLAGRDVALQQTLSLTMPEVKVYGGLNGERYTDPTDGQPVNQPTADVTAEMIVGDILTRRAGLLMQNDSRSSLGGLLMNAPATVVDGFHIKGDATVNHGLLSTSITGQPDAPLVAIKADPAMTDRDGTVYNSLVYGDVDGVRAVNVTATGTISAVEGNANNRQAQPELNRYVVDEHWKYQLNETSTDLNGGKAEVLTHWMASAGHERDLAGNRRVRNEVDNGCFETWNLTAGGEATEGDFPVGESVVYVRSGHNLLLTKDYTAADAFAPGFLLLEHHAGLLGNGKEVRLTNFAVERQLPAQAAASAGNGATAGAPLAYDLAVMPFNVRKAEGIGTEASDAQLYLYDAHRRAAYDSKVSPEDGMWSLTQFNKNREQLTMGWLIAGPAAAKVRFYGDQYEEKAAGDGRKYIKLITENHNDAWTSGSSTGNKFTHKENMSWNLFGSPYLCAMKYADMEYGRVIYGYRNGQYVTISTFNADPTQPAPAGYIPAGDAVFTQSATLKELETFGLRLPSSLNGEEAYAGEQTLRVAIDRQHAVRSEAEEALPDVLQLRAVAGEEARTDFDPGSDGVKWTGHTDRPLIYAVQNGGHYSLLSAVSREGTVTAGVRLPETGSYSFAIPADCDLTDYEVVLLHDAVTGLTVDLMEAPYDFATLQAGCIEDRFTLSFVRHGQEQTGKVRARRLSVHSFRVTGTQPGDLIRIFSSDGKQVATSTARSTVQDVEAYIPTTAIVEVKRNGQCAGVVKVR